MTADIVNLRRLRKQRARAAGERTAAQNRLTFGRAKDERHATDTERERADRRLSGHRRDPGSDETVP